MREPLLSVGLTTSEFRVLLIIAKKKFNFFSKSRLEHDHSSFFFFSPRSPLEGGDGSKLQTT